MTNLLLARHGETDWNAQRRWQGHDDPPLNERGRAQARELAHMLVREQIAALYASDLRRARETAEIVASHLDLEIRLAPELRELSVGSWSGLTTEEIEQRFPEQLARHREAWGTGWVDGERPEEMAERALAAVLQIAADHPSEQVLLVTHGGVIRALGAAAAAVAFHEYSQTIAGIGNCSVSRLACEEGTLRTLD